MCVSVVLSAQAPDSGGAGSVEVEVATGLRAYFDKALMAVLLYRSERPQVRRAGSQDAVTMGWAFEGWAG